MCGKASCVIHARVDGGGEVEFVLELELLRLVLVVGDAALDGVTAALDVLLHEPEGIAVGDLDLAAHDVDRRGSRSPDGWLRTSF